MTAAAENYNGLEFCCNNSVVSVTTSNTVIALCCHQKFAELAVADHQASTKVVYISCWTDVVVVQCVFMLHTAWWRSIGYFFNSVHALEPWDRFGIGRVCVCVCVWGEWLQCQCDDNLTRFDWLRVFVLVVFFLYHKQGKNFIIVVNWVTWMENGDSEMPLLFSYIYCILAE